MTREQNLFSLSPGYNRIFTNMHIETAYVCILVLLSSCENGCLCTGMTDLDGTRISDGWHGVGSGASTGVSHQEGPGFSSTKVNFL